MLLPNGRILTAGRVMLHCAAWSMPDPGGSGRSVAFVLPPEPDMCVLWRGAGGDDAVWQGAPLTALVQEPPAPFPERAPDRGT